MDDKDKDGIQVESNSTLEESEASSDAYATEPEKKEKKEAKKEPKTRKREPEEPEEDDEYDDEEEYEDESSNVKIIILSIIIAVLIAAIAIVVYQNFKSNSEEVPQTEETELTESETERLTEAITESNELETAAPTATPKPLPTATPLPVTPEAETDGAILEDNQETLSTESTTEDMTLTAGEESTTANIILLGDSRFREMANVVSGDSVLWECSATGDYNWLTGTAYPDVDSRVGTGTKILINVGINDLNMSQSYAQSINTKAKEWKEKGALVYYVSVGPVSKESAVSNQEIADFNTYMFQNLDKDIIPFIDAYNYLVAQGFSTVGDVYDNATNTALYQYLMDIIK